MSRGVGVPRPLAPLSIQYVLLLREVWVADPKSRHFCTVSQAAKYDPGCAYVPSWLKELEGCDDEAALRPYAHALAGSGRSPDC